MVYVSMNDQLHENGQQWNTSCKVRNSNFLQSELVETSAKTDSTEFLSSKNGLHGCVHVPCPQGY